MELLHYVEIENFKQFESKLRIDLNHPTVLIGPNNCGKTTALQAIALWSQAIKTWVNKKATSRSKKRLTVSLNRLEIVSAPVLRTRYFWHNAAVRAGSEIIPLTITVGFQYDNHVEPVTVNFRNNGEDLIYCDPGEGAFNRLDILKEAAKLDIGMLYPMSGLDTEEPVLQSNRINALLGQGQTAQVLRNLCLLVYRNSPDKWKEIVRHMWRMFSIKLRAPKENSQGFIDLLYNQDGVKIPLDIYLSGRGFQQVLLILSYLYSHNRKVLLIDEPDAHLEILRQRQIFILLRDIAEKRESQVVLATHSEVLMDEGLHDGNLTLLLGSKPKNLAKNNDVKEALKYYNTLHYLRAYQRGHVLYLEGRTDFHILHQLAEKLDHRIAKYLDVSDAPIKASNHPIAQNRNQPINVYYFCNDGHPDTDIDAELKRIEGGYGITPEGHFLSLRRLMPKLRGLAIRDGDARNREDIKSQLSIVYWKRYEIENYFVTRELLIKSIEFHYQKYPLLLAKYVSDALEILNLLIQQYVFDGNQKAFNMWSEAAPDIQQLLWEETTKNKKLSTELAEKFYQEYANKTGEPMLYRKGTLYRLIKFTKPESIPDEIAEKLDLLYNLLENSQPQE